MAQFLHKDIGYSIRDVEKVMAVNDRKAKGASEEVKKQADVLNQKMDALQARIVQLNNFDLEPVEEEK